MLETAVKTGKERKREMTHEEMERRRVKEQVIMI